MPVFEPRSQQQQAPRLYDRSFVLALASQTGFVLAWTLTAHYARWIAWLGGGVREVGWVMGVGSIAGLLLRPWLGQWINRFGARTTWFLGYGIFAVSSLGNLLVGELGWEIYVLRSGLVLGTAFVFASNLTYVSQAAPIERRTEAIGTMGIGGFLGMLMGPFLGDLILGSGTRGREDFTTLFVTAALAILLPALLLCFVRAPHTENRIRQVRPGDFPRTVAHHWPGMILLVVLGFGMAMTVPFGFLPEYIDEGGLLVPGMSEVGLFFFGYAGCAVLLRLSLRRVPDRIGRRKVLLAGLIAQGAGMFSFLLIEPDHAWALVVPGLVLGAGHGLAFHTMTSLSLEHFPLHLRGTGSALTLMTLDVGTIGGAPMLGLIADAFGYEPMFVCLGAACLAAAGAYALASIPVWRARRAAPEGMGSGVPLPD